jgi:hypothetical protein
VSEPFLQQVLRNSMVDMICPETVLCGFVQFNLT